MWPVLALIGSMVSLTVGASFAKTLFPLIGAEGTTAYRVVFSALLLLAVWRPWRLPLSREAAFAIARYGAVLGLMNLCFYLAVSRIPLGIAIAIEFLGPLAVATASSKRGLDWLWIAFAVAGLLPLMPMPQLLSPLDPLGVAYALGAAVCWALYILAGQRASLGHPGQATSLGMVVASCVVLPVGVAHAGAALLNPTLLVAGAAIGLLSSAIPYSLEMVALKRLPKQTFSILLSLEPAIGVLTGWIVLGERLTMLQGVAIMSIMIASVGSAVSAPRSS